MSEKPKDKDKKPKPGVKPVEPLPPYTMPAVEKGDSVLWMQGLAEDGEAVEVLALVTEVHDQSVSLATLQPSSYNFDPYEGVRHQDHPNRDAIRSSSVGCWKHRPAHLQLLARLEAIESMFEVSTPAAS